MDGDRGERGQQRRGVDSDIEPRGNRHPLATARHCLRGLRVSTCFTGASARRCSLRSRGRAAKRGRGHRRPGRGRASERAGRQAGQRGAAGLQGPGKAGDGRVEQRCRLRARAGNRARTTRPPRPAVTRAPTRAPGHPPTRGIACALGSWRKGLLLGERAGGLEGSAHAQPAEPRGVRGAKGRGGPSCCAGSSRRGRGCGVPGAEDRRHWSPGEGRDPDAAAAGRAEGTVTRCALPRALRSERSPRPGTRSPGGAQLQGTSPPPRPPLRDPGGAPCERCARRAHAASPFAAPGAPSCAACAPRPHPHPGHS